MVDIVEALIDSALEAPELFTEVAMNDPVAGVMLAVGTLLMAGTLGFLLLLVSGMAAEVLSPEGVGRRHPRVR